MDIAILVLGAGATLFAFLSWLASRQHEPFTLGEKREGIAQLTRTKRPAVQILEVFVFGHSQIITADAAAQTKFREMGKGHWLILGVEKIPVGETVIVRYRRVWPWDALTILGDVTQSKKIKRDSHRRMVDEYEHKGWKNWGGVLM